MMTSNLWQRAYQPDSPEDEALAQSVVAQHMDSSDEEILRYARVAWLESGIDCNVKSGWHQFTARVKQIVRVKRQIGIGLRIMDENDELMRRLAKT